MHAGGRATQGAVARMLVAPAVPEPGGESIACSEQPIPDRVVDSLIGALEPYDTVPVTGRGCCPITPGEIQIEARYTIVVA